MYKRTFLLLWELKIIYYFLAENLYKKYTANETGKLSKCGRSVQWWEWMIKSKWNEEQRAKQHPYLKNRGMERTYQIEKCDFVSLKLTFEVKNYFRRPIILRMFWVLYRSALWKVLLYWEDHQNILSPFLDEKVMAFKKNSGRRPLFYHSFNSCSRSTLIQHMSMRSPGISMYCLTPSSLPLLWTRPTCSRRSLLLRESCSWLYFNTHWYRAARQIMVKHPGYNIGL